MSTGRRLSEEEGGGWEIDGQHYARVGECGQAAVEGDLSPILWGDGLNFRQPLAFLSHEIEYYSEEIARTIAWAEFLQGGGRQSSVATENAFLEPPDSFRFTQTIFSGSQNAWPVVRTYLDLIYTCKRAAGIDTLGIYANADAAEPTHTYVAGGAVVEMILTEDHVYLSERGGVTAHNYPHWDISVWPAGSVDADPLKFSRVVRLNRADLSVSWQGERFNDALLVGEPSMATVANPDPGGPPLLLVALAAKQIGRCIYPHQLVFDAATGDRLRFVRLQYDDPTRPGFIGAYTGFGPTATASDSTVRSNISARIRTALRNPNGGIYLQALPLPLNEDARRVTSWGGFSWHTTDPTRDTPQDFSAHANWLISQGVHVPTGPTRQICGFSLATGERLWKVDGSSSGLTATLYYPILASEDGRLLVRAEVLTYDQSTWRRWGNQFDYTGDLPSWGPPTIEEKADFLLDVQVFYQVRSIQTGAIILNKRLTETRISSEETIPVGDCVVGHSGQAAHYRRAGEGSTSAGGLQLHTGITARAFVSTSGGETRDNLPWVVHGEAFNNTSAASNTYANTAHQPARLVTIAKDLPPIHHPGRAALSTDQQLIIFEPARIYGSARGGPTPGELREPFARVIAPGATTPTDQYFPGSDYEYSNRNWVVAYNWQIEEVWRHELRDMASVNTAVGCSSTNIVCTPGKATLAYCPGQYGVLSNAVGTGIFQYAELVELDVETGEQTRNRPYWAYSLFAPCSHIETDYQTMWATQSALLVRSAAQTGLLSLNLDP